METKRAQICCYETQCAVLDFEAAVLGSNYGGETLSGRGGDFIEVIARVRP